MKKTIYLIIICILLLTGCTNSRTYYEKGLSITMEKGFYYKNHQEAYIYLVKNDIYFTVLKESYSSLIEYDLNKDSKESEYIEFILDTYDTKYEIYYDDNLTYFMYSLNDEYNVMYKYLVSVHKGNDSFWICSFSTKEKDFNQYKDIFIKWSKSIKVK